MVAVHQRPAACVMIFARADPAKQLPRSEMARFKFSFVLRSFIIRRSINVDVCVTRCSSFAFPECKLAHVFVTATTFPDCLLNAVQQNIEIVL